MAYQRITLAQLRQSLQETWEQVPFWTPTDATSALNETLRWWNLFTGMWRRTEVLTITAGEHYYALTSTLVLPANVRFQGYPLDVASITDLDMARPSWEGEDVLTPGCPSRPATWAPHGMGTIAIWPAVAFGTAQLEIDGVRNTPVLVNDADYVDLGEEEVSLFLGEALYLAAFKEGGSRWAATQANHKAFLHAAVDKNSRLKMSAQFRKWAGIDVQRGIRPWRAPIADPTQGEAAG